MGHVPPGPVPREGASSHLPRCQRRETGENGAQALTDPRRRIGALGEDIAAWWLTGQGLRIVDRNLDLPGGEVDLVARDGAQTVVVEVRCTTGDGDPIDAIDDYKRRQVRRLAATVGAARVDFVGVGLAPDALNVHWVPG